MKRFLKTCMMILSVHAAAMVTDQELRLPLDPDRNTLSVRICSLGEYLTTIRAYTLYDCVKRVAEIWEIHPTLIDLVRTGWRRAWI